MRAIPIVAVPFLLPAFLILFFLPERTGEQFAWAIKPPMSALTIGAGYHGGGCHFIRPSLGSGGATTQCHSRR